VVASGDGSSGLCLIEGYDTGIVPAPPLLRNLAARGRTAPNSEMLTAGFVISGNGPLRLLIRGLGPALAGFGVGGTIADPQLYVFSGGASTPTSFNSGWSGEVALAVAALRAGAFPLLAGSRDAALLTILESGTYTVQLPSASGATGTGMIEIYVVDF
jgi:hypothetical protein